MILVDIHSHLYYKDFTDLDEVIKRAENAGVKVIACAGIDVKSNRQTLEIASKYPLVKAVLGIYPPDALDKENKDMGNISSNANPATIDIDKEIEFIRSNKHKIIGIGEIGLDFSFKEFDMKLQMDVFVKQLNLAKLLNLPVIVHSRKAEADIIGILEKHNMKKVVLHCFCGKKRLIKVAIEKGWYFSIPTNIVRSSQFQELVEMVPLPQLLTETDAPFLSPYPGMRNEPAFVLESVKKIASIKKIEKEEAANIIFSNYQRLFL